MNLRFRYLLILLFSLHLHFSIHAQKRQKSASQESEAVQSFSTQQRIYQQGLQYNDLAVATQALHTMIALQPENTSLRDTLARLYFQRGAWPQCIFVTDEVLAENPNDPAMLELRAVSKQTIGMPKEALADFETLYGITKNVYHLYEVATLQFSMRRFGECEASVTALLEKEEIKEKTMVIGSNDGRQEVPFPAACLNLRGVLDMEQGKKETARTFFNAALKVMPTFELAKNNLAVLEGNLQTPNK